ncbi:hypothetical protein QBC33DRAFT_326742 [Phialemonium atrogriseum]|uniref:Uncharacterized protein n=1 Tax=Phialemonium atrogriseum TaxID=1093897 RepID=A0AAJ0FNT3_9PEZI|nr:uncharacterized protein QBC33DRAFT_326742 [Phialemonium atrogriseum]KAK1769588.1 hypothetical protein QBC33DRAFT_326742 [Phialemonium atrogriseum]
MRLFPGNFQEWVSLRLSLPREEIEGVRWDQDGRRAEINGASRSPGHHLDKTRVRECGKEGLGLTTCPEPEDTILCRSVARDPTLRRTAVLPAASRVERYVRPGGTSRPVRVLFGHAGAVVVQWVRNRDLAYASKKSEVPLIGSERLLRSHVQENGDGDMWLGGKEIRERGQDHPQSQSRRSSARQCIESMHSALSFADTPASTRLPSPDPCCR